MSFEYNKDYERRDDIIFGRFCENTDTKSFKIGITQLNCLIDEKFIDPNETQNASPSVAEFKKWSDDNILIDSELVKYLFFIG